MAVNGDPERMRDFEVFNSKYMVFTVSYPLLPKFTDHFIRWGEKIVRNRGSRCLTKQYLSDVQSYCTYYLKRKCG